MYDHVLVGTDGSATATRAVEAAARLAHAHRAKLTIAHAFKPREVSGPADAPVEHGWRVTAGGAADLLVTAAADRAHAASCGGITVETRVEPGHPMPVLLSLVRELEPCAVVVGNADIHRLRVRRSLGHALSRRASADVVVVDTRPTGSTKRWRRPGAV